MLASVFIVACATPDGTHSTISVQAGHFDRVLQDRSGAVWRESVVNTTHELVASGLDNLELVRKSVCELTAAEEVSARNAECAWADAFNEMARADAIEYGGMKPELAKAYDQDVKNLMHEALDRQFTAKRDLLIERIFAEAMQQNRVRK